MMLDVNAELVIIFDLQFERLSQVLVDLEIIYLNNIYLITLISKAHKITF